MEKNKEFEFKIIPDLNDKYNSLDQKYSELTKDYSQAITKINHLNNEVEDNKSN